MAYGLHYTTRFKNRRQNDIYRIEIHEKDYAGDEVEPIAIGFEARWPDLSNLLEPIHGCEMTVGLLSRNEAATYSLSLLDFYSEDEQKFRADFYCEALADATSVEQLLHTGFLVMQDSGEPLTDRKHVVTLKASDHLGILKEISFDTIFPTVYGKKSLWDIISYCLKATGLYSHDSTFDQSLHLRTWCNLFETSTDNRDDDPENDPLRETFVHTGMFQNSDGTYLSCYEVLTKVLTGYNAYLCQAEGFWNVVRRPEYNQFVNGHILGTDYDFDGITQIEAVELNPVANIDRKENDPNFYPVNEDQLTTIQRPFKFVKTTFNYEQPENLIKQSDLSLPDGATPFDTTTVGDLRYDDYDLGTYFTSWEQRNGDDSFLRVVTDTVQDVETERYIVTPGAATNHKGVQFNPIEVTEGDVFDFSLRFRTDTDSGDDLLFRIRFLLLRTDAMVRALNAVSSPGAIFWSTAFDCVDWDTGTTNYLEVDASEDSSEYHDWSLSGFLTGTNQLPKIPQDGILLIQVDGTNASTGFNQTTEWKDITLTITNNINDSTKIIGHTHLDEQTPEIKNNFEEEIYIDDSPRNPIAGTLFTDEVTTFCGPVGNVLFTRTSRWSRADYGESKRLGEVLTEERLLMHYAARTIVEGTFANVRYYNYDDIRFVSPMNLIRIDLAKDTVQDRFFLFSGLTVNYMNCEWQGKMIEAFRDGEDAESLVLDTDASVTTYSTTGTSRPIEFTAAATEVDFSPDGSFIIWTYSGITAPVEIVLILAGTWTATDVEATLNLKVNGVVVESYVIGDGNPPNAFSQTLTYNTTLESTDTISVSVDWVGATAYTLDIDSGSLQVTRFLFDSTYTFKYLYEQT